MREMRNSLIPYGEQQFPRAFYSRTYLFLPDFQPDCWRKGKYNVSYCGNERSKERKKRFSAIPTACAPAASAASAGGP